MRRLLLAAFLSCAALASGRAEDPPTQLQTIFGNLMNSVQSGSYEGMLLGSTDAFKQGLTRDMAAKVSAQLAPRMKEGFTSQYLGSLRQANYNVYLWKLSFHDNGNDMLAKVVIDKDGRVAGFWLD